MPAPSTAWKEIVAPGEAERHAGYLPLFAALQQRRNEKFGAGRALHRKPVWVGQARFEVLAGLPEHARHGLFAAPGIHDALVRLSNGGMDNASDRRPDIRGFSFKVQGLRGPGAMGQPEVDSQHFLLINRAHFGFPTSDEFVGLVDAVSRGSPVGYMLRRYGLLDGLRRVARLARTMKQPFGGFAASPFHSAVPFCCGPYAARMRLLPPPGQQADPSGPQDWGADMTRRLAQGPLSYEVQLQFFTDEANTPIEDASVDWSEAHAPHVTVARLTLPQQAAPAGASFGSEVEAGTFDPWAGLMAHRPLGEVMRARRVMYFDSVKRRAGA